MHSVEFERIGKRLFAEHLVGGNFGNISIRRGKEGFFIKRSGTFLDVAADPVFVTLKGDAPPEASSEYRVHLEVYRQTRFEALVHAHPPYAIAALHRKTVKAGCSARKFRLSGEIPVLRILQRMFPELSSLQNW
jgi:L-fuculose-phosphate aldolase